MKKIAIFGDSITAGWNGFTSTNILEKLINDADTNIEISILGFPGDDTNGGVRRLNSLIAKNADYNFIFFGANDAAKHHQVSCAKFQSNLEIIIQSLSSQIVLITPPAVDEDKVNTLDRNNQEILIYVNIVKNLADKYQLPLIDLYSLMIHNEKSKQLYQSDGLHFSHSGYKLLANQIVMMLG